MSFLLQTFSDDFDVGNQTCYFTAMCRIKTDGVEHYFVEIDSLEFAVRSYDDENNLIGEVEIIDQEQKFWEPRIIVEIKRLIRKKYGN